MTSHTQCKKTFQEKLAFIGLEGKTAAFATAGINAISAMATSCHWNPEQTNSDVFKDTAIKLITSWDGNGAEPAFANNLRQLMWDCIQAHIAETRNTYDPGYQDLPPKMGKYDRLDRRKAFKDTLRSNLPEIDDDEWDPAWGPEDDLYQMFKDNALGDYMGPAAIPTRRQELKWKRLMKKGRKEAAGTALWKMITGEELEEDELVEAEVGGLHLLEIAFKRRGMLMHTTGLMTYAKTEDWRRRLWKAMKQEVTFATESPPGIADILRADQKIWNLLADKCIKGVQPEGGVKPMDRELDKHSKEI